MNQHKTFAEWLAAHAPPKYKSADIKTEEWRGLGDVVAAVAKPIAVASDKILGTHIQGCAGCRARQEALNKAVPFTIASK